MTTIILAIACAALLGLLIQSMVLAYDWKKEARNLSKVYHETTGLELTLIGKRDEIRQLRARLDEEKERNRALERLVEELEKDLFRVSARHGRFSQVRNVDLKQNTKTTVVFHPQENGRCFISLSHSPFAYISYVTCGTKIVPSATRTCEIENVREGEIVQVYLEAVKATSALCSIYVEERKENP